MSAGLGTLQRNIINEVEINSPIYQRELMWQLAFDRGAIMKTGTAWNDIEEGSITASFKENFRRAIRSLDEQHAIIIKKQYFSNIFFLIDSLPYLTSRLECYLLSLKLIPSIKKYAQIENEKKGRIQYETFTIQHLDKNKFAKYSDLWEAIEESILNLLYAERTKFLRFDRWLNIQMRGRYLFKRRKEGFDSTLQNQIAVLAEIANLTPDETSILILLQDLISLLSKEDTWQKGTVKDVLYTFFNATKHAKHALMKDFLFEAHTDLLSSLPSHVEPKRDGRFRVGFPFERKYSPLLDKIINKHILRQQSYIYAAGS